MLFRVWLWSIFVGTGHYHWRFLLPTLNGLPVTAKKTMTSIRHPHGSTVLAGFFFFFFFHYFITILFEGQQSNTKNSRFGNLFYQGLSDGWMSRKMQSKWNVELNWNWLKQPCYYAKHRQRQSQSQSQSQCRTRVPPQLFLKKEIILFYFSLLQFPLTFHN